MNPTMRLLLALAGVVLVGGMAWVYFGNGNEAAPETGTVVVTVPPTVATPTPVVSTPVPTPTASVVDSWTGKWGESDDPIIIDRSASGTFTVTARNVDGPGMKTYPARAEDATIVIEYGEWVLRLKRTSGKAAGDRKLWNREDCLTAENGTAYCRR